MIVFKDLVADKDLFFLVFTLTNISIDSVGDVIFAPNDMISVQRRTNATWAIIRGAHKISKKTKQGTKANTSGLFHQRSYAEVAAAPA